MAVESENVEQLMNWLVCGGEVRSSDTAAETLVEKLAALVFQGDSDWPDHGSRVADYRNGLSEWFVGDSGLWSTHSFRHTLGVQGRCPGLSTSVRRLRGGTIRQPRVLRRSGCGIVLDHVRQPPEPSGSRSRHRATT
jgi:hypothetical protein